MTGATTGAVILQPQPTGMVIMGTSPSSAANIGGPPVNVAVPIETGPPGPSPTPAEIQAAILTILSTLPDAPPAASGQLWNNGGSLSIS